MPRSPAKSSVKKRRSASSSPAKRVKRRSARKSGTPKRASKRISDKTPKRSSRKTPKRRSTPKPSPKRASRRSQRKSSPRRRSPRKVTHSMYDTLAQSKDSMIFWAHLGVVALVVVWSVLYGVHEDGFWDGLKDHTPSWGDSQALIITLGLFWYLSASFVSYHLSCATRDKNVRMMLYSSFVLLSVLFAALMYVLADGNESYTEAFYIILLAGVVNLFIVYFAAMNKDPLPLWMSVASLAVAAYLIAWMWQVKESAD